MIFLVRTAQGVFQRVKINMKIADYLASLAQRLVTGKRLA